MPVFTGAGRPPPLEHAASVHVSVPAGAQWLNVRFGMRPPRPPSWPLFYAGGVVIASLLLASLWMGRRVARPLQRLAEAARRLRIGEARVSVPETGPQPVREAARAFNAMSERVTVTLQSQRALMAAVAHDLRTPIAALRVRAEFVADEDTRARLLQTISEMQAMTEAVLDAVRIDGSGEPARPVDVATLADSLCADMAEIGGDVTYGSEVELVCVCRAAEVRRALRNLIENALRYGLRARVSAEATGGLAAIHIDDDGPGIPDGDIERVFEPFARLEHSRSAETGGYGLGLAITRLVARGHGGDVTLKNRAGGGLRATLTLPLA
jgi:signal transduction histidine kinase